MSHETRPGSRLPIVLAVALATMLLPACGGGSGGGGARRSRPAKLELGTVGLAAPIRVEVKFGNPTDRPADVTVVGTKGPFTIDPLDLPAACGGGGEVSLGVICSAGIVGDVKGSVTLGFEDGGRIRKKKWKLLAWCEPPDWELLDTDLDFGGVFLGESADLAIRVENRSGKTPVGITEVKLPAPEFSLAGTKLPLIVPPGATGEIWVRFTPSAEGPLAGDAIARTPDASDPRTVTVRATGRVLGTEVVTDYGDQPLDTAGVTPILSVEVPEDAFSLSIEGVGVSGAGGDEIRLDTLTGPSGFVYENTSGTGPFSYWSRGKSHVPDYAGAFLAKVPNSDRLNLQLERGGGTYTFSLKRTSGVSSKLRVRAYVERRAPEVRPAGIIDVNVFLGVGGYFDEPVNAERSYLEELLYLAEYELSKGGLRFGEIDTYDVPKTIPDDPDLYRLGLLFRTSALAKEGRVNVYLIPMPRLYGADGLCLMTPGPKCNGTDFSGVIARAGMGVMDVDRAGFLVAHEIGHYLGLWHVVDLDGTPDLLDDTPLAWVPGAFDNLMLAAAAATSGLTAGQSKVMLGHPLVRTDPDARAKPLLVKPPDREFEPRTLPPGWCGSCGPRTGR